MSVPDTLLERLRIYRATGRVFRESDELFTKTSWLAVLDGQGPEVEGVEPLAEGLPLDQVEARLARIAEATAQAVRRMPAQADFIRAHGQAGAPVAV
jgi:tryptophan halogenase